MGIVTKQPGNSRLMLQPQDLEKWGNNVLLFFAPAAIIYFGALAVIIQSPGHVFSPRDFVPNSFVMGSTVLYLANVILDYARKINKPST